MKLVLSLLAVCFLEGAALGAGLRCVTDRRATDGPLTVFTISDSAKGFIVKLQETGGWRRDGGTNQKDEELASQLTCRFSGRDPRVGYCDRDRLPDETLNTIVVIKKTVETTISKGGQEIEQEYIEIQGPYLEKLKKSFELRFISSSCHPIAE